MISEFKQDMSTMNVPHAMQNHGKWKTNDLAIICGEDRITWGELARRMNKLGNALINAGFKKDDKICVLMPNMTEWIEVFFGLNLAGCVSVPLSTMVQPETLALMIEDCDAVAIFVGPGLEGFLPSPEQSKIPAERYITVGFEHEGWNNYEHFVAGASEDSPDVVIYEDDIINLMYTSGTTGNPKGVVLSHASRRYMSMGVCIAHKVGADAKSLITTPFFTNLSLALVLPTVSMGGTLIVMKSFDPMEFLRISLTEKPTHCYMVPLQYTFILQCMAHPEFANVRFDNIYKVMINGGAALKGELKKEVMQRFACEFFDNYGATEGGGCILWPDKVLEKAASVGRPCGCDDVVIVDDDGNEVPRGEIGEVCFHGANMMNGYYKKPEKTAEVIWVAKNGDTYLRMGDCGYIDEDGFVFLADRKKDIIISGGFNIYASDIEKVVRTHPAVLDVAVIGVSHEKWGETPVALVMDKPGETLVPDEVMEFVNARVGKYQRLSAVIIDNDLPRNVLGKVVKKDLREKYKNLFA